MAIASAALGAVGSIVAGNRAADAQENAASMQVQEARDAREEYRELAAPYTNSGANYLAALNYELGLGDLPQERQYTIEEMTRGGGGVFGPTASNPFGSGGGGGMLGSGDGRTGYTTQGGDPNAFTPQTYYMVDGNEFGSRDEAQAWIDANGGFNYTPYELSRGAQFQIDQGLRAIDGSAAARGNLFSGATLQSAQRLGQGIADQDRQNHLNMLMGGAGIGQAAVAGQAANMNSTMGAINNAYGSMGNAQAANAINTGNALSGLAENVGGWWGYQNAANSGNTATMRDAPWASSGFWG